MATEIQLSEKTITRICQALAPMVAAMVQDCKPLLTSKQKAEELGITVATLRKKVCNGEISAIKLGTNKQSKLRFKPEPIALNY